jgi:hypothetical protein
MQAGLRVKAADAFVWFGLQASGLAIQKSNNCSFEGSLPADVPVPFWLQLTGVGGVVNAAYRALATAGWSRLGQITCASTAFDDVAIALEVSTLADSDDPTSATATFSRFNNDTP